VPADGETPTRPGKGHGDSGLETGGQLVDPGSSKIDAPVNSKNRIQFMQRRSWVSLQGQSALLETARQISGHNVKYFCASPEWQRCTMRATRKLEKVEIEAEAN
jgi:hypothetical protein